MKATKLKSGNWRCRAYAGEEIVLDEKGNVVYLDNGKAKKRKKFKSFTASTKKQAEYKALEWQTMNEQRQMELTSMTLMEAVERYIDLKSYSLSPTTLVDYTATKRNAFKDIMNLKLCDLNEDIIQMAVNRESKRFVKNRNNPSTISVKRLKNEYGLIRTVIHKYRKDLNFDEISLPKQVKKQHELIEPEIIMQIVKGSDIELPVLLAMWLSFTVSEILGLTKSKSLNGDMLSIREVVVKGPNGPTRKKIAKNEYRNRTHKLPSYILDLINQVDGDIIVNMTHQQIHKKWTNLLKENHLPHITFHDLRHVNASVMAMLNIPDKYAQERGGWKTDHIMKTVYQQTFSNERKHIDEKINAYFEEYIQ